METHARALRLGAFGQILGPGARGQRTWGNGPAVGNAGALPTAGPGCSPLPAAELVVRSGRRDFDAVDLGVVLDGDELDGDRPAAAGGSGERLGDRLELAAGGGEDVEVGQDLAAVDEDVEGPRPGGGPVLLGEVEPHRVAGPRCQPGDGVGEVAVAVVLVDRLRGGVGDAGGA